MNLQPLDDRIVVRPSEAEEKTASGLVIPDTAKEKPQQGQVLAVGPGRRSEQTGDIIPLARHFLAFYGGIEGPRLTANLVDVPIDAIRIGMPVEVVFDDVTPEISLPRFRRATG